MSFKNHCELCRRQVGETTEHHLIPRSRHKVYLKRRDFDRSILNVTVALCHPCHKHIHAVLTEREMERAYRTLESLAAHPDVAKFVAWIAGKPDGTAVPVRRARTKGRTIVSD